MTTTTSVGAACAAPTRAGGAVGRAAAASATDATIARSAAAPAREGKRMRRSYGAGPAPARVAEGDESSFRRGGSGARGRDRAAVLSRRPPTSVTVGPTAPLLRPPRPRMPTARYRAVAL